MELFAWIFAMAFAVVAHSGRSDAKNQSRSRYDYTASSTGPYYDFEPETSTPFPNPDDEIEPELRTVGSCTKTALNVDIQEIDYAWCIQDLAKYIRSVTVERFLASNMSLSNTMEFDYQLLPGTWGFMLKTFQSSAEEGGNKMEITIYYNTTDPDIVIQPELILRVQEKAALPCIRDSAVITRVEDKQAGFDYNHYDYFIRTTKPPPRTFYSYQTKFAFFEASLRDTFCPFSAGTPRRSSSNSSADDLDLIFRITTAKKITAPESVLTTSCDEPSYRVLAKRLRRDHIASGASSGYISTPRPFGNLDTLIPRRYSYSTPTTKV